MPRLLSFEHLQYSIGCGKDAAPVRPYNDGRVGQKWFLNLPSVMRGPPSNLCSTPLNLPYFLSMTHDKTCVNKNARP